MIVPLDRALDGQCDLTEVSVVAPWSLDLRVGGAEWRAAGVAAARSNRKVDRPRLVVRRLGGADAITLDVATGAVATQSGTVVERALIETTIAAPGDWHSRARYWVSATAPGRMRLHVPRDGRVTRIRWNGKMVGARPDAGSDSVELVDSLAGELPALLEVESEGNSSRGQTAWSSNSWDAPILLGDVSWGRVFWQLNVPDEVVVWRGPVGYSNENRVLWREFSLDSAPRYDPARLDRWLTGSESTAAGPETGERVLFSRLLSVEPMTLTCVNRTMLILIASFSVMLFGFLVVGSSGRLTIWLLFGAVLLVICFAVLQPMAALASARSAVLGVFLVLIAGAVHTWLLRRSRPRRTVFHEPAALAKGQVASARGNSEFTLGPATGDVRSASSEPPTTAPRRTARSSSVR